MPTIAEVLLRLITTTSSVSALAALAAASACTSQSPDEPTLADLEATRIGMTRQQVERRIGRLERVFLLYDPGAYTFGFSDGRLNSMMQVVDKGVASDWRGVEHRMTIAQVENIMGRPSKECLRFFINKGGKTTVWLDEWELCFKGGVLVDKKQVYFPPHPH